MQSKWTLVKISQATRKRLEAVRDSMILAECIGLRALERDPRDRVSLDQVVNLLIDIRERHAERRKRSAAKKRRLSHPPMPPQEKEEDGYWELLLNEAPDPEKSPQSAV